MSDTERGKGLGKISGGAACAQGHVPAGPLRRLHPLRLTPRRPPPLISPPPPAGVRGV